MGFGEKTPAMQGFLNEISSGEFGISITDALNQGICVQCKEEALPKCYSEAGWKEYTISGLCESCFDVICGEEPD